MPRLVHQKPRYRLHKRSGQAVVTLGGRDFYLGPHGSPQSRAEYDPLVAAWTLSGRGRAPASPTEADDESRGSCTIDELILAYLAHAEVYYRKDGRATTTQQHIQDAIAPLHDLFGGTLVRDFGPRKLKLLRQHLIDKGAWCRNTINKSIGIVRRMFRWGVEQEMVPPAVIQGLQAVAGLKRGRTTARESQRVLPVPDAHVDATIAQASAPVAAMIELQILTGMRPGEVVIMRGRDIDTSGTLWVYTPASHKTEHHGHDRRIYLGPRAQQIIRPFLVRKLDGYLFSPLEAEAERRARRSASRKTPLSCGNRAGKISHGSDNIREHYDVASYRRAITYACEKAFPPPGHLCQIKVKGARGHRWETKHEWKRRIGPERWNELRAWREAHHWHPHQLRHNAATYLRKQFGIEAARVVLGHRSAAVTEIYAELDYAKAAEIMGRVG